MNLSDFNPQNSEAITITLKSPYDDTDIEFNGKPVKFTIHSMMSKPVRDAKTEADRKDLGEEERGMHILASLIQSWENVVTEDGNLKFSYDNAVKLFQEQEWIANQILAVAMDTKRFAPKTQKG